MKKDQFEEIRNDSSTHLLTSLKISSKTSYGPAAEILQNITPYQLHKHPHNIYFVLDFQMTIDTTLGSSQMKNQIKFQVSEYIKSLFQNLFPYLELVLEQSLELSKKPNIGFKQFVCMNLALNIVNAASALKQKLLPFFSNDQNFEQWLAIVIEDSLKMGIDKIKKQYLQSKNEKSQVTEKMKKCIKNIDRSQNEQYDIFLLEKIPFENSQTLIAQALFKINQRTKDQQLNSQILRMFNFFLNPKKENKDQTLYKHLKDSKNNVQKDINIRKIREPLDIVDVDFKEFVQYYSRYPKKINPNLQILTNFLQNLLNLIEEPQKFTLYRQYPYKDIDNQFVYPSKILNKRLYDRLLALKKQLSSGQIGLKIKNIKESIFKAQCQILFCDNNRQFLKRQISESIKMFKKCLFQTIEYLKILIDNIISAGEVQLYDVSYRINLVTFNLRDVFRACKSVGITQFQQIINNIYLSEMPRKTPHVDNQKVIRLIQVKDQTQTDAKGVLINLLFKNTVSCQIQINTKEPSLGKINSNNQICLLLCELQKGQFGIITEIFNVVASNYLQGNHKFYIIQSKSQNSNTPPFIDRCEQQYKKSSLDTPQNKIQQVPRRPQKVDWGQQRIQCIWKQMSQQEQKNLFSEQYSRDFIKYIMINGQDIENQGVIDKVRNHLFLQHLVMNKMSLGKSQESNNLKFINLRSFKSLRVLDLSNNYLSKFQSFSKSMLFSKLQILNLSNNRFRGSIQLILGWYPKLRKLILSQNQIKQIHILQMKGKQGIEKSQKLLPYIQISGDPVYQYTSKDKQQAIRVFVSSTIDSVGISHSLVSSCDLDIILLNKHKLYTKQFHQNQKKSRQILIINQSNFISQKSSKISQQRLNSQALPQKIVFESKDYIERFKVILKKMVGRIKDTDNNLEYDCLVFRNSNLIIVSAQAIIHNAYQLSDWRCPQRHLKTKRKSLERLSFFPPEYLQGNSSIEPQKCQEVWVNQQYINTGQLQKGICLLFLEERKLAERFTKKNVSSIAFHQQNSQPYNLFLTGFVVCSVKGKGNGGSYASIKYSHQRKCIQFFQKLPSQIPPGLPIFYVNKVGGSYKIYLLGMYLQQQSDRKLYGAIFDSQFQHQYRMTINNLMLKNRQVGVSFEDSFKFMNKLNKLKSIPQILVMKKNGLLIMKRLFEKIIQFLQKYLFFNVDYFKERNINYELILHVFISNFYSQTQKKAEYFEIDLFGFPITTIFECSSEYNFYQLISSLQKNTQEFITIIVNQINLQGISTQINMFIEKYMNNSTKQNPFSLIKILKKISLAVNQRYQISYFIEYLSKVTEEQLIDRQYFDEMKVLLSLNSIAQVDYYAEVIKISKVYFHHQTVLSKEASINKFYSFLSIFQSNSKQNHKSIKAMNQCYFSRLQLLFKSSQNPPQLKYQNSKELQLIDNAMQKIFFVEVLNSFYQISLNKDIYQINKMPIETLFKEGFAILKQKLKTSIQNCITYYSLLQNSQIEQIEKLFESNLQQQVNYFILLYKICYLKKQRLGKQAKLIDKQQVLKEDEIQKIGQHFQIDEKSGKQNQIFRGKSQCINRFQPTNQLFKGKSDFQLSNHIGVVLIYDQPTIRDTDNWMRFARGTGSLIDSSTILTAASLVKSILDEELQEGKVRFRIKMQDNKHLIVNVKQVRLVKNRDVALFILEKEIKKPILRLFLYQNQQYLSIIKQKRLFCKLIGFNINKKQAKCQLLKSQGLIMINNSAQQTFKHELQSYIGQEGSPIIFYPTGNLRQPFIIGLHVKSYNQTIYNSDSYYNKRWSEGLILSSKNMQDSSQLIFSTSEKFHLQVPNISNKSYVFTQNMLYVCKWILIKNLYLEICHHGHGLMHNLTLMYENYGYYWKNRILIQNMHADNIICFDERFSSFFDAKIVYQMQHNKQTQLKFIQQFQKFINQCQQHIQSAKIVQKYIDILSNMSTQNNMKALQLQFAAFADKITKSIVELESIQELDQLLIFKLKLNKLLQIGNKLIKSFQLFNTMQVLELLRKQLSNQNNDDNQRVNLREKMKMNKQLNDQSQIYKYQSSHVLKLTCEIIYRYYEFCRKNGIKRTKFEEGQKFKRLAYLKFDKNSKYFKIERVEYYLESKCSRFLKGMMKSKYQAILFICKNTFLDEHKKQQFISSVLNWKFLEQQMMALLSNLPSQDQADISQIEQIINQVIIKINFQNIKQRQGILNKRRIILQWLYFIKILCIKYKLGFKIDSNKITR